MQFRGQYWFLSNMYPCTVTISGYTFKCAEAAFQACKCIYKEDVEQFTELDGFSARKLGKRIKLRGDWNSVRVQIMLSIVSAKFKQNPELMSKLKAVAGEIAEENSWGDTFWGVCNGKGQNQLGKILMSVRDMET